MKLRVIFLIGLYYILNIDASNQQYEQFKYIFSNNLPQNNNLVQLRNGSNYNVIYPFTPPYLYENNNFSQANKIQGNLQSNYLVYHYPLNNQPKIDICKLPQQIGLGPYKIPRWSYNFQTLKCDLFYWSGCCANENNFQSENDCLQKCQSNFANSLEFPRYITPVSSQSFKSKPPLSINDGYLNSIEWNSIAQELPLTKNVDSFKPLERTLIPVVSTTQSTPLILQPALPFSLPPEITQSESQPLLQSLLIPSQIQILPSLFFPSPTPQSSQTILTSQPKVFIETPNPCAYNTSNKSIPCNIPGLSCSSQQFCHVGPSISSTICCKKTSKIDQCNQPLNIGIGNEELKRFYYDPITQHCQSFYYRGYQGNENNFLSLLDCQENCQDNPCLIGSAYHNQTNILYCSTTDVCPNGFYCHIGENTKTSVCCPNIESNPCIQKLEPGTGFAKLVRWYFDPIEHKCFSFIYSGIKGNQNNFLTKENCNLVCNAEQDPCRIPTQKPLKKCIPGLNSCNNPNLYCHIGATQDTTVCCLAETLNKCLQLVENGIGETQSQRWYYDLNLNRCRMFTYAGMKGNQNNFITQNECEEDCLLNPCPTGKPFMKMGRIQTCSASTALNTCPVDYWCHIGLDATTSVCCPNASSNPCHLPMSTGNGLANLERYYYDDESKTCRLFYYRGFKGNQNNFLTIHRCQLSCQPLDNPCIGEPGKSFNGEVLFCSSRNRDACPVNFWCHFGANPETSVCCPGATNACSVPLAPGTGNEGLTRWYYSSDERRCILFQYNGKRGNQNNFLSKAECDRTCPEQLCFLSIDRGSCNHHQMRYAYNRQTEQCVPFEYSGCGGNLNNFLTLKNCKQTCENIDFKKK